MKHIPTSLVALFLSLGLMATDPPAKENESCKLQVNIPKFYEPVYASNDIVEYEHAKNFSYITIEKKDAFNSGFPAKTHAIAVYDELSTREGNESLVMENTMLNGNEFYIISWTTLNEEMENIHHLIALRKHCDFVYEWNLTTSEKNQHRSIDAFLEMLATTEPIEI